MQFTKTRPAGIHQMMLASRYRCYSGGVVCVVWCVVACVSWCWSSAHFRLTTFGPHSFLPFPFPCLLHIPPILRKGIRRPILHSTHMYLLPLELSLVFNFIPSYLSPCCAPYLPYLTQRALLNNLQPKPSCSPPPAQIAPPPLLPLSAPLYPFYINNPYLSIIIIDR